MKESSNFIYCVFVEYRMLLERSNTSDRYVTTKCLFRDYQRKFHGRWVESAQWFISSAHSVVIPFQLHLFCVAKLKPQHLLLVEVNSTYI